MPHKTTHPHSVPAHLQGKTQKGFQGGKNKVIELFENKNLKAVLRQLVQKVLPSEVAQWFALDCAKFVLPVFQEQCPNDKRVINCIQELENFLKGKSTLNRVYETAAAAYDAAGDTCTFAAYSAAHAAYTLVDANTNSNYSSYFVNVVDACYYDPNDEMQGFIKNWIDQYFSNLPN